MMPRVLTGHRDIRRRGAAMMLMLGYLAAVTVFVSVFIGVINRAITSASMRERNEAALAIAEGGLDRAIAELRRSSEYTGQQATPLGEGLYSISVKPDPSIGAYQLVSQAELREGGHTGARARITAHLELDASGNVQVYRWEEVRSR